MFVNIALTVLIGARDIQRSKVSTSLVDKVIGSWYQMTWVRINPASGLPGSPPFSSITSVGTLNLATFFN